ncbi:MAG: hypothetical protein Q8S26_17720 [Azonexus sp.]|nr:hypothetical protein [Azonexus sp.]
MQDSKTNRLFGVFYKPIAQPMPPTERGCYPLFLLDNFDFFEMAGFGHYCHPVMSNSRNPASFKETSGNRHMPKSQPSETFVFLAGYGVAPASSFTSDGRLPETDPMAYGVDGRSRSFPYHSRELAMPALLMAIN